MYNVLLVDDNPLFTMGLTILIKKNIKNADVQTVKSLAAMDVSLKDKQYQMLIICLSINSNIIINKIYDLKERFANLCIFLCYENTVDLPFQRLYKVGIRGIIDKHARIDAFNTAILQVRNGSYYIDNGLCMAMLSTNNPRPEVEGFVKLSNRENTVAKLLLEGKSNLQIGELMKLQPSTISTFKNKIYKKLQVSNLLELINASSKMEHSI